MLEKAANCGLFDHALTKSPGWSGHKWTELPTLRADKHAATSHGGLNKQDMFLYKPQSHKHHIRTTNVYSKVSACLGPPLVVVRGMKSEAVHSSFSSVLTVVQLWPKCSGQEWSGRKDSEVIGPVDSTMECVERSMMNLLLHDRWSVIF